MLLPFFYQSEILMRLLPAEGAAWVGQALPLGGDWLLINISISWVFRSLLNRSRLTGRFPRSPNLCLTSLSFLSSFETRVLLSFWGSDSSAGITLRFCSPTTFHVGRLLLNDPCCLCGPRRPLILHLVSELQAAHSSWALLERHKVHRVNRS